MIPILGKARRADIFVAWRFKNEPSSVGAAYPDGVAPTELEIILADVLQICRAYGAMAGRGRRSRVRRARTVRFPATRKRRAGVWP